MPRLGRCGLLVLLAVGATVIPAGVTQAAGPPRWGGGGLLVLPAGGAAAPPAGVTQAAGPPPVRTTGTAAMTTNGCSPEASSCTATLDQASWTPNPAQPGQPVTFHARFFIE